MSLPDIVAAMTARDGRFHAHVPPGWRQGRTVYGGLGAALAYSAVRRTAGDLAPLRSAQIAFVGPVGPDVEVEARLLRQGRSASYWQAKLDGDGAAGMRATFLFAGARTSHLAVPAALIAPERSPEDAPAFPFPPAFAANFDYRFASRRPDPPAADLAMWVRLKMRDALDPVTELLCVGDALPPAALMVAQTVGPLSSMTWQFDLMTDRPETRDGWWLLRSTTGHAADGITTQRMSIWNADGEAVASAMQTVALFF